MIGKITAVLSANQTVAVEVPVGKMPTKVLVRLSNDTILKKSGRRAGLADFAVGDWVNITWEKLGNSNIIEVLEAD
jgi:hypothetical protein